MTDSPLSPPLALPCGASLPNRLLKSAMTEGLADREGRPTEKHVTLYRRWAEGGTGTLVTGNVMVDRRYLERPGNVVIEDERDLAMLRRWAEAGTGKGNQLWMQINHPGRQCSKMVTRTPVAPSEVQLRLGGLFGKPRGLSDDEIEDILARFGRVAAIAKRAGFTGVQVHAAHGYLASQFLSPRVNRRTDRWGGNLENRARFVRRAVQGVRKAVGPDFPVSVKLNSSDFQKGAFSNEDACQVAAWLVEDGIDLLEVSGGTYERLRLFGVGVKRESPPPMAAGTRAREAYFLEYAQQIRAAAKVPLCVTGGFRTRSAMEQAVEQGLLDVVGLARPLCVEPDLPAHLLRGTADEAPRQENELRLADGWLGPSSENATVRSLNVQAQTAWYYHQILELAAGRDPDLDYPVRKAWTGLLGRELRFARARAR